MPGMPPPAPTDAEFGANLPREGLAFHHLQQAYMERDRARLHRDLVPPEGQARLHREMLPSDGQTLDLSMPKKRDSGKDGVGVHPAPPPSHSPLSYAPPASAHSKSGKDGPYRNTPTPVDQMPGYMAGMRAPAPYPPRSTPPAQNSLRPMGGSIMQGTPLVASPSNQAMPLQVPRTDGLLRPAVSGRDSMSGSITQGTPIVGKDMDGRGAPGPHAPHPSYDYYKNMPASQPGGQPPGARLPYPPDPQSYSRQIILSDYLLSQQMQPDRNSGAGRKEREAMSLAPQMPATSRPSDRPPPPPSSHAMYQYRPPSPMYKVPFGIESHHAYPAHSSGSVVTPGQQPPPTQQQQQQQPPPQQRQGVIQRNSSVRSQPDPRPSPPAPSPVHLQQPSGQSQARTSSPAGGLLTFGQASLHPGRAPPVSISPRGDAFYGHDGLATLVNAAAAQQALPVPVPERDRRDREREKERDPRAMPQAGLMAR